MAAGRGLHRWMIGPTKFSMNAHSAHRGSTKLTAIATSEEMISRTADNCRRAR